MENGLGRKRQERMQEQELRLQAGSYESKGNSKSFACRQALREQGQGVSAKPPPIACSAAVG